MVSMGVGLLCLYTVLHVSGVRGWSQHERVLLRDIQAITLYADRYTNARRSSPIPQLKCIGGSAGCSTMIPQVVQCHNRGWDGIDVQWECKVEMDNSYQFGKIEVSCEGFDYPEDPYVLRGSCGLEYTLERTEEGRKRHQNGYSSGGYGSGYFQGNSKNWNTPEGSGALVFMVILGLAYGVYKLFLSGPSAYSQQPHPGNSDNHRSGYDNYAHANAPPPPGFKAHFTGSTSGFGSFARASAFGGASTFGNQANQGPGFWTGLGTGGVLGYLFGNRRAQPYYPPPSSYHNTWSSSSFSEPFRPPQSSGVRTASGFGGTKRR